MTVQAKSARKARAIRLCGGALAAALAVAGSAFAQTDDDPGAPHSVAVRYADLNLSSEAGARAMLDRITDAASRACGGDVDLRMLERRALYNRCKADTIDRAVRALDAPLVTAMANRTGAITAIAQR
jgi:UrcA family protein